MTTARATSRHTKEVYTGRYIDYDDPQPEQISMEDIAHSLAHLCRYGGHTRTFYSVAEHALLVSSLVLERLPGCYALALHALHHDDHEAYLGDLPTPLKNHLGGAYEELRDRFDAVICEALDLIPEGFEADAVQRADAQALRMETYMLMESQGTGPDWAPAWERFGLAEPPHTLLQPPGHGRWSPGLKPAEAEGEFIAADLTLRRELGWL